MSDRLIFSDKEIRFLRELTRNRVPFMVVGLSAAALQGAPMVTQDVDLWFGDIRHPGIRKALKALDGVFVSARGDHPPMFVGAHVELFDIVLSVHGIGSFEEELKTAFDIPLGRFKVKVLPLDRIIASKTYLNRQKDRMVLPALRSAARAVDSQPRGRIRKTRA